MQLGAEPNLEIPMANRTLFLSAILLALFAAFPAPRGVHAGIIVLDFEGLAVADTASNHGIGSVYTASGMTLTALHFAPTATPDFNFGGTLSNIYAGSTMLFHHISLGEIVMTRTDGGVFDLLSIDLAEIPNFDEHGDPIGFGPFTLAFNGTRQDLSTVSAIATIQDFPAVSTFAFADFTDLISVTWFQGAGGPGLQTHQFDNIRLSLLDSAPVPEPTSLALWIGAVATAGIARLKGRRIPRVANPKADSPFPGS